MGPPVCISGDPNWPPTPRLGTTVLRRPAIVLRGLCAPIRSELKASDDEHMAIVSCHVMPRDPSFWESVEETAGLVQIHLGHCRTPSKIFFLEFLGPLCLWLGFGELILRRLTSLTESSESQPLFILFNVPTHEA